MKLWLSNFDSGIAINTLRRVALNSVFLQLDAFTWQSYKKIMSCQSLANVQEDNPTHLLSAVQPVQQYYLTQYKTTNIPMQCLVQLYQNYIGEQQKRVE